MQPQGSKNESFANEIVTPSLKVGALGGTLGLLIGTFSGTIRSKTPLLFATASGIQCFCIGSTFWASRAALLHARTFEPNALSDPTHSTYLKSSAAAGAFTGSTLGLLFRGPRNIIPGAIVFTIFGYTGQKAYNFLDDRHTHNVAFAEERAGRESVGEGVKRSIWQGFVEWMADPRRKWSPIKKLSDREYEEKLQEKLIGVEADLALVDEEIQRVKTDAVANETQSMEEAGR